MDKSEIGEWDEGEAVRWSEIGRKKCKNERKYVLSGLKWVRWRWGRTVLSLPAVICESIWEIAIFCQKTCFYIQNFPYAWKFRF